MASETDKPRAEGPAAPSAAELMVGPSGDRDRPSLVAVRGISAPSWTLREGHLNIIVKMCKRSFFANT